MFSAVDDDTHTGVRHHDVGNALAIRAKAQGASAERRIGFVRFAIHDEKTLTVLLHAIGQAFAVRAKAQRRPGWPDMVSSLAIEDDDLFLLGASAVGDVLTIRADDEEFGD